MALGGTILALAVGALMSAMAIKTGSSEAVQGAFPLLFIAMFFSSAFFPRETMSGVYKALADLNPISYLVEGFRDLTIDGFSASAVVRAVVIPAILAVLAVGLALLDTQEPAGGTMTTLDDTTTSADSLGGEHAHLPGIGRVDEAQRRQHHPAARLRSSRRC